MDRKTVRRRLQKVQPAGELRGNSAFALAAAAAALVGLGDADEDRAPTDPFKRKAYWQAASEEQKFRQRRGELIERSTVEQLFASLVKTVVLSLETLPDEAERRLGLSAEHTEALLEVMDSQRVALHGRIVELAEQDLGGE